MGADLNTSSCQFVPLPILEISSAEKTTEFPCSVDKVLMVFIYSDVDNQKDYPRAQLLLYPIVGKEEAAKRDVPMIGMTVVFPKLNFRDHQEYYISAENREKLYNEINDEA